MSQFVLTVATSYSFKTLEDLKRGTLLYLKESKADVGVIKELHADGEAYALLGEQHLARIQTAGIPATQVALAVTLTESQPDGEYKAIPLGAPPKAEPAPPLTM